MRQLAMAVDADLLDAAFAAQQRQEATAAHHRAQHLRDDAVRRGRRAAERQAATETRLRRGIHRNDPGR